MQPPGRLADDLLEPRLDVHVHVFERARKREAAFGDFRLNAVEPFTNLPRIGARDNAALGKHCGMGLGAGNILCVETLIETDRGVDLLHDLARSGGKAPAPHLVGHVTLPATASDRIFMSKDTFFGLKRSTLLIILGCLAGVVAAFYGIYAIGTGDRNAPPAATADNTASAPHDVNPDRIDRSYAQGDLAAFVIHDQRKDMADVSFFDESGKERALSEWRGRVVLLNLWATWCAPCRKEMPTLAGLETRLGSKDFEVVAISVDRKGAETSGAFLIENHATALTLYADPSATVLEKVKAVGLPASILIDRQGREIGRMFGPAEWNGPDAERLIRAAIAEGPS